MRMAMLAGACILAACASDRLATAPPSGVDLSGHWTLDEADSDDAQRLLQSQLAAATANASGSGQTSAGRRGARGAGPTAPLGPAMPPVTVLDEGLRWPGKDVSIKQSGSVITFSSGGSVRDCQVNPAKATAHSAPTRGRGDAPPPRCGWDQRTLVVQSGEPEEDHPPYEQRFSVSSDGQRLVEIIMFKGGRSEGFTASRVWNRVQPPPSAMSTPARP
ncbi:MAG: hypothetical protein ABSG30_10910 [Steroidobacteraceae bacterium]